MAAAPVRPLLFLDVDGPLNPYAPPQRRPAGYTTHRMKPECWIGRHPRVPRPYVKPLRVWLNPTHGPLLLALPYELVWATSWRLSTVKFFPISDGLSFM